MTLPRRSADPAARRARALADRTRRALLADLAGGAADVRRLADAHGLHPNAVRQHLAVLRDAGLVVAAADRSGRPGRPRTVWRAVPEPATAPAGPVEHLAALLVEVAAGRTLAEVGDAAGRALAAGHGAGAGAAGDPAAVVAAVARAQGFDASVRDAGDGAAVVALGACPFARLAGPVVCELHRAVAAGAADAAGTALAAFEVSDPTTAPCELVLAPTRGAPR